MYCLAGLECRAQRRGVVATGLDASGLRSRAGVLIFHVDAQGLHAAREIVPDRACKHDQLRLVGRGRGCADIRRGAEQQGPHVQGARGLRNLVPILFNGGADHLGELCRVRLRENERTGTLPHPLDVPIHAEYVDAAVGPAIGLEPLETRACVVKYVRGGVQLDGSYGANLGGAPLAVAVLRYGHAGSEDRAKSRAGGLLFDRGCGSGVCGLKGCRCCA